MERPRENRSVLMRYVLMAVILFAPALAAQSAPGFTWTVGPANLQGTSPIFGSIQAAIAAAANGDTVLVYPGTYYESIDLLGKNLTVVSAQGPTLTTINGGQANAVVRCVSGEARAAVIGGFTITNGRAAFGGGFLILNAQPTIRRCRVVANTALTAGGGVYMSFGVPRFENCDFASNTALNYGGGAATDYGSAPEFYECSFTGNGAAFGGAVGNNLADPVLDRCTLNSNVASQGGGGVDSFGGQVRIYDSTISQNSAPIGAGWRDFSANSLAAQVRFIDNFASNFGGGLAAYSGSMRIENGLFHGNSAPWGGAIFDYASGLQVRLTTITANSAGISGGAWASVSGGPSLVENSILWANTPNEIAPSSAGGYPTTTFRYSNIAGGRSGSGNIALDPLFADPVALDFHLTAASPCRDAGAAWYAPPPLIDADGNCRFLDGAIDMGSDEYYSRLSGSSDGLDLQVFVAGRYGPASPKWAPANVLAMVRMDATSSTFANEVPVLAAQFFSLASIPLGLQIFPAVHLDPQEATIIWTGVGVLSGQDHTFGIGPAYLQAQIPAGLTGVALRLQLFAVSPLAQNGFFGVSDAMDLVF